MTRLSRRRFASSLAALTGCAFAPRSSRAQTDYPARQIKAIAFSAPGGSGDVMQRLVTDHLAKSLGYPVVIDYRAGANGILAATATAKSEPDGYTFLVANIGPMAINKALYNKLPYDPERDFEPVTLAVTAPLVLVTSPTLAASNVPELIALAKRSPQDLTFGYPGPTGMLAGASFMQKAGIDLLQVSYRTVPATMTDLIAGRIQLFFAGASNAIPMIADGKAKALAVTTKQRSPLLPDVPTFAESGLTDFILDFWTGFFVPANTPRPIVDRLNAEIRKALLSADVKDRLQSQGDVIVASTPEELRAQIARDVRLYREVVEKGKIPQLQL